MANDFPELSALQAGDQAAWDEAFPHLWPVALRAAQHPGAGLARSEAEDVASEAVLELIARIEGLATAGEARALVATIAFRRAISLARRKSAAKRQPPGPGGVATTESAADPTAELTEVERSEMVRLLRQALQVLDAETRQLLREKLGHNLTYQEIADRHGLPVGTVCTKVARGLKKVRDRLQGSPLLKELQAYLR